MKKIAIIGCGNMGEAILRGLLKKKLFQRSNIIAFDKKKPVRSRIKGLHVKIASSAITAIKGVDIILVAVKPQDMDGLLKSAAKVFKGKLIISIAAGITTDYIRRRTEAKRIIRAMPNTPALVNYGITAISAAKTTPAKDLRTAGNIFSAVGEVIRTDEKHIDAITAISGSGPAYVYALMEAMTKAGLALGLGKATAEKIAFKAVIGAGMLQHKTGTHPAGLRGMVTSKGGTTEAALRVFKNKDLEGIVKQAIKAAAKRAKELSK